MNEEKKSSCEPLRKKLVYACSGASDLGAISDQAARRAARSKVAFMSCAAGIGAQIPDLVNAAREAGGILAIDGCKRDCVRLCFERAGIRNFAHLQFERDFGWEKGKTPPSDERIQEAANRAIEMLTAPAAQGK